MARLKQIEDDFQVGRAAADRLSRSWPDYAWVPDAPSYAWARGAIERFREIMDDQPAIFKAMQEGAEKGASTLSPRLFQGLLECIQNADDLGATKLQIAYRKHPHRELLIVHDGSLVTLANVGAMLLPWLSTKDDDPHASGRFGIGQKTLKALGEPIALHAPPFHFIMETSGPVACPPEDAVPGVYDPMARHTMLLIPLNDEVDDEQIAAAVRELNTDALLFLRTVRRLEFNDLVAPDRGCAFGIDITETGTERISFGERESEVKIASLRPSTTTDESQSSEFLRYFVLRPTPKGEKRLNKATAVTTPLGVCVRLSKPKSLPLYDRMPLPISIAFPIGLNAQFEPDSARSHLREVEWNVARMKDLGLLLTWAALKVFRETPEIGWRHVPLVSEVPESPPWLATQLANHVVGQCHKKLRMDLKLRTPAGLVPLQKLAYESEELEGLLTDQDLQILNPQHVPVPLAARDGSGRWRKVLDELGRSKVVDLWGALKLLNADLVRHPDWFVCFAVLAKDSHFLDQFLSRPSLFLADGSVVTCARTSDRRVFVRNADPRSLSVRLGLVQQLHPAYFDTPAANDFLEELRRRQVLFEDRNGSAAVLDVLGRARSSTDPVKVADADLLKLRDAWAKIPQERQSRMGINIGSNLAVKAVRYDQGKPVKMWARPVDAYLPAAIDRETESFAKSAERTPGITWIDGGYSKLLRPLLRRSNVGAQRLFSAWGATREPRLIEPPNSYVKYSSDPRRTSRIWGVHRPPAQVEHISSDCTDLLSDYWSPDLEAVVANILTAPTKTRRKRAIALLSILSRAWERRYADHQNSRAVFGYYGWNLGAEVQATWLARVAEEPWIPDAANGLRRASQLQLPVPGIPTALKDRARTLGKVDDQIHRSGILAALGVKSGPTPAELINQLQILKGQEITRAVEDESLLIYQLLVSALNRDDPLPSERMSTTQLRNAFRAGRDGKGLLLAAGIWRSPETVFQGPKIFGTRRAFAPYVEGLEPLWKVLQIPFPAAKDAIAVLRELSGNKLSPTDLGVMLTTLRFLAPKIDPLSPQVKAKLKDLPLWTGSGWTSDRPIFALEGDELAGSVPGHVPVWRPGITSFEEFEPLFLALAVTKLTLSDFRPLSTTAHGFAEGEDIRRQFAAAVSLLKQEFIRADQSLLEGISVDWSDLLAAHVAIDEELYVVAEPFPKKRIEIPVSAYMCREPLTLLVRSPELAGAAEGGGEAVASLFAGDRQKVAYAWSVVWQRAWNGDRADEIVIPRTKAEKAKKGSRLLDLKRQSEGRQGRTSKLESKKGGAKLSPIQVRKLRELDTLEPTTGKIVNSGKLTKGLVFNNRQLGSSGGRTFSKPEQSSSGKNGPSNSRSVLPPMDDREALALDAVRRALRLDAQQIVDLRSRRGVGVDAIDELRQCYEIKMSSSATIPKDITLTASEVDAAKMDPDFFLAIVSGLEDGAGTLRVRFIFDPLRTLALKISGGLTLTGVDEVEALEYEFNSTT